MTLTVKIVLVFLLIGSGVVQAGIPPFSSTMSGPYGTVNLSSLNVYMEIPVVSRNGRGAPFAFNIQYDSAVLSQTTVGGSKTWTYAANYGWQNDAKAVYGNVHWYSKTASCTYQLQRWNYTYFVFDYMTDSMGVRHGLTGAIVSNDSDVVCNPYRTKSFVTVSTNDGSGYTVRVSTDGSEGYATVYPVSGGYINPMSYIKVDPNGNEITFNGSSFVDTLGTTVLSISGAAPGNVTYTYQAPAGPATVVLGYTIKTIQTAFGCTGVSEATTQNVPLLTSITYPDRSYQIGYEETPGNPTNTTGRIASLTLPTGGQITYAYSGGDTGKGVYCTDGSMATVTIGTPDGDTAFSRALSGSTWQTTVTDPQENQTILNFSGNLETKRTVSQYASGQQNTLLTKTTCYNGNFANCDTASVTATPTQLDVYAQLPNGSISLDQSLYNSGGLITEHDEYDYGVTMGAAPTVNPARKTLITYATLGNYISNLPGSEVVQDGSGNVKAQTTYSYDETAVTATSGTPQHGGVSGSRGNLTTVTTTISTSPSFTLSKHFSYYDTGNVYQATDVNGGVTTYVYGTNSCGNSFPTQVNLPLSLSTTSVWNCTGAVVTSGTDLNGKTVSTSYSDPSFWRPDNSTDQSSNVTHFAYKSPTQYETYLEFNSNNSISERLVTLDSLGRTSVVQRLQGPGATNYDSVQTTYDALGRPYQRSIPYVGTAGQASGAVWSTLAEDPLGRPTSTTDATGGYVSYTYTDKDVLQSVGPAPTGENLKQKQLQYNGLGQRTSVCEMTSAANGGGTCLQATNRTGFWTKYTYDTLGDLTLVTQNAQATSSSQQARQFTFDMVGRLLTENNPENGTTYYTYDLVTSDPDCNNQTLNFAGDLVKKKDAKGNFTCYQYDKLHRVIQIAYYGPGPTATPTKTFVYDAATVNGTAMANAKGHLAEAYTGTSTSKITDLGFNYTAVGFTSDLYQKTPNSGGYYHVTQTWRPNGAPNQLSGIPNMPTITFNVDGEGRVNTVADGSGTNPVTRTDYDAASMPTYVKLGSLDSDTITRDVLERPTNISVIIGSDTFAHALNWNTNGSLGSLQITAPTNSDTCTYAHDDLQRLQSVSCPSTWSQTFGYDPFGNISKTAGTGGVSFSAGYVPTSGQPNNQIQSGIPATYDANGNLLSINTGISRTYTWDADGNAVTVEGSNVTYDALDRAVEISSGSSQILYGFGGTKLALMSGATPQKVFIPLSGGLTAVYDSTGTKAYYRHPDWLGSSRLASTPTRTKYSRTEYAPFGEPYDGTGTRDRSFTGADQDTSSSLYDMLFRRLDPVQGRWMSPDPAGLAAVDLTSPQTWNRYAYVGNNPLSNVDPLGLLKIVVPPDPMPDICGVTALCMNPFRFMLLPLDPTSGGGGWFVRPRLNKAANNAPACAPSGTAPAPNVYQQRGQLANNMTNSYDPYGMSSAAGAMYNLSELYQFKRGNALDAQVRYGGSTAYANYVFGVYLSAAGWTLPQTLAAANDYARTSSSYPNHPPMDPNYPSTPAANVANITAGYNAQQNGTLCHK